MSKVIHLTSVHPPQDVRIFYKECLTLQQHGHEVKIIAQAKQDYNQQGINILAVRSTRSRLCRMTIVLWQIYMKALREDADVYHFHDPELIIVGLLLKLKGKKVIYDIHEDLPRDILLKRWLPPMLRGFISKIASIVEHFSANYFDALVTVTPQIANRFHRFQIVEVRNYPLSEDFSVKDSISARKFLCYSGLITEERGMVEMAQISRKSQLPLLIAGNFPQESLMKETLATNNQIKYLGYIDRQQLRDVYSQSFVGLALLHSGPTFTTSLPLKLFEYMAAGLPVLASNFPLWQEIVETHACGFCIDPRDIEQAVEKILFLKENPDLAHEMGQRGVKAVATCYSWHTESKKLINLYQTILGNN